MAVCRHSRPARLYPGPVLYIDYLETAPWNLRTPTNNPHFFGVGTVLIAEAVRISKRRKSAGAIGLHSLPQAEVFYAGKLGMTRIGPDPEYYDLSYFEFDRESAVTWLKSIGELA